MEKGRCYFVMPLIIAVLAIMVIFLNGKDSNKKNARDAANRAKDSRKTNASLEQRILDTYLKYGYSFDDAFRQTYQDMFAAGYEPCIPYDAYVKTKNGWSSLASDGSGEWWHNDYGHRPFCPGIYDSEWVRHRRRAIIRSWEKNHPKEDISSEELERLTYENFPKSEWGHQRDINISANMFKAEPIGTFIIYPGLGTCEVLGYKWIKDGAAGGTYRLKVLKTGEEVTYVRVGDEKIRKQT